MKKDKKRIWCAVLEALCELVLALLFLGIGKIVMGLLGVNFESENIDYELIILVGVVVFLVIFVVIYAFAQWIKNKINNKRNKN